MRAAIPALLAAACALAGSAGAQEARFLYGDRVAPASGACQAAMPAFDALLRKQPLALANVGASDAFVTCAPHQSSWNNHGVELTLANRGTAAVTITCTSVVAGFSGEALYLPRSVRIPAGQERDMRMVGDYGDPFQVSCTLPPQTAVVSVRSNTLYG